MIHSARSIHSSRLVNPLRGLGGQGRDPVRGYLKLRLRRYRMSAEQIVLFPQEFANACPYFEINGKPRNLECNGLFAACAACP